MAVFTKGETSMFLSQSFILLSQRIWDHFRGCFFFFKRGVLLYNETEGVTAIPASSLGGTDYFNQLNVKQVGRLYLVIWKSTSVFTEDSSSLTQNRSDCRKTGQT